MWAIHSDCIWVNQYLSRIKLFRSFSKQFDSTPTLVYKQFFYFIKVACIQQVLMYMAHGQRIQTFQKFKQIGHTPYGRSINKEIFAKNENSPLQSCPDGGDCHYGSAPVTAPDSAPPDLSSKFQPNRPSDYLNYGLSVHQHLYWINLQDLSQRPKQNTDYLHEDTFYAPGFDDIIIYLSVQCDLFRHVKIWSERWNLSVLQVQQICNMMLLKKCRQDQNNWRIEQYE